MAGLKMYVELWGFFNAKKKAWDSKEIIYTIFLYEKNPAEAKNSYFQSTGNDFFLLCAHNYFNFSFGSGRG